MTALANLTRGISCAKQILKSQNSNKILGSFVRCESSFVPKRVLILAKISRYQLEKLANPKLNEAQLKDKLIASGNNYEAIFAGYQRHKATKARTIEALEHLNITYRVRDRHDIDVDSINWADLIVPVGGDGTFLLASNLIRDNNKPIVGINSDPEFSEGFLMLPRKFTNNIPEIFERLKSGDYKYLMRSRIRMTLQGENIWQKPFHVHENPSSKNRKFYEIYHEASKPKGDLPKIRQLPWLALNEVFIGESLSARISILHINTEGNTFQKVKSSGMCVTTGTGSSSWYRVINSLNPQVVEDVLLLAGCKNIPTGENMKKLCYDFNSGLQYPADQLKLSYAIRDMIVKHVWPLSNDIRPRGFCDKLTVRSQCYDGGLVIDGGIGIRFNTGTTAIFETLDQDTLRNIVLLD